MYIVKEKIENGRKKLTKIIQEENNNFSSKRVLTYSRKLDRLLLKYMKNPDLDRY